MAFTQTDLDSVEAAIATYGSGRRVAQMQSGDKMTRYMEMSISDLLKLRALMQAELGLSSPRTYARQGGRGR
jgi:hypothetical protein